MIGTGVFATGGTLLKSLGSPGLVLVFWLVSGSPGPCHRMKTAADETRNPDWNADRVRWSRRLHGAFVAVPQPRRRRSRLSGAGVPEATMQAMGAHIDLGFTLNSYSCSRLLPCRLRLPQRATVVQLVQRHRFGDVSSCRLRLQDRKSVV